MSVSREFLQRAAAETGFETGVLEKVVRLGEFAGENGLRAFYLNLQVINEPGKYWSLTDYPEYGPLASVGDPSKWIIVDLRAAREPLRAGKFPASDKLTRFVFNFDAVLLMGGASKGRKL